jgi:hypothetical protein
VTLFGKPTSFAEDTKKIGAFMAQTLKPLGYKKRRNCFNRRLVNGLIHQLSIFSVGAYSIDHGKFYVHAGCYIPEAELYRNNVINPKWVPDYLCAIRGHFPMRYLKIRAVAADLDLIAPHLNRALDALARFDTYDPITSDTTKGAHFDLTKRTVALEDATLYFETPQPLVKVCILLAKGDSAEASTTLQHYLAVLQAKENPHLGHIEIVSKWATEMELHISSMS